MIRYVVFADDTMPVNTPEQIAHVKTCMADCEMSEMPVLESVEDTLEECEANGWTNERSTSLKIIL